MEIVRPSNGGLRRSWTRRGQGGMGQRIYSTKRTTKVVKLGGGAPSKKCWKLKVATPKLRLISPVKIWRKFQNGYMNMMLHVGGTGGDNAKRIPKARQDQPKLSNTEFDNRLIYEIYKSLSISMELNNS